MEFRGKLKQACENRAWIPNSLTALRLLGGIALIFLPLPGTAFYIVYVNAETGEEENILILIEDENGVLTI